MRSKGREGWRTTQLLRAAETGDEKRVRELVAAGAPLDLVDFNGESALHLASYIGHVRIAKLLLDGKYEGKGADKILQNKNGWTPLMLACFSVAVAPLSVALLNKRASIVALLEAHGVREWACCVQ